MIKEAYVSFKVAKLLKEKGFLKGVDLRTTQNLSFYDNIGLTHNLNKWYDSLIQDKINFVVAPTHQMAMKWLREVHDVYIDINICVITKNILKYNINVYYKKHKNDSMYLGIHLTKECSKYEEAVETACLYVLNNLI